MQKRYGSDLSDEQWTIIRPFISDAKFGGRPRTTDMRRVVDAIFYLTRTGCQWRQLPHDFPTWQTVYRYFAEWRDNGTIREVQRTLSLEARVALGRKATPTVLCLDSQSVKTSKAGGDRGYDGGKRIKGRKRHVLVDTSGILMEAAVTPANCHDKVGGKKVLTRLKKWLSPFPTVVHADGGYDGRPFSDWAKKALQATVEISANIAQVVKRFVPVRQRWVIERSFAWICDFRRLEKDYERLKRSSLAMIRLSAIFYEFELDHVRSLIALSCCRGTPVAMNSGFSPFSVKLVRRRVFTQRTCQDFRNSL